MMGQAVTLMNKYSPVKLNYKSSKSSQTNQSSNRRIRTWSRVVMKLDNKSNSNSKYRNNSNLNRVHPPQVRIQVLNHNLPPVRNRMRGLEKLSKDDLFITNYFWIRDDPQLKILC